ncbi:MAG: M13 family metallopeptidase [Deltaproteobacteria bacterium]|nr:M13 family metallopeptidase [Deltaproteobacteria bacterium]
MSRLKLSLLSALLAAACQSAPQPTPDQMKAAGDAAKTVADAAKPAGDAAKSTAAGASSSTAAAPGMMDKAAAAADKVQAAAAPVMDKATEAAIAAMSKLTALDESALDKTVKPCDDFYQFACGGWLKATPIPDDRAAWGRGFNEIAARNEALVKDLFEQAAAGKLETQNPDAKKMADYYGTCMDESKDKASLASLKKELKEIDGIKDGKSLAKEVALLQSRGVNAFFNFGSDQDAKDATKVIGSADQGGMGLPDKDYYNPAGEQKDQLSKVKAAYATYQETMFTLLGEKPADAKKHAAAALAVESSLSDNALRRVERRDPKALYNRLDRKGLVDSSKGFDWDTYFTGAGIKDVQAINVAVPKFYTGFGAIVADKKKLADLKTYLKWRAMAQAASSLGGKYLDAEFAFTQSFTGAKQLLPRWKRCVAATSGQLGEMVGRTYVEKAFGGTSKPMTQAMIKGIEDAFNANLATLTWMDDETKAASAKKLSAIVNKIGYPDKWRDYGALKIGTASSLENRWAASTFEHHRDLAKIDKPLDRGEWGMPPALVNAQYNPALNDITFPAGILQYPFFKDTQHPTANFGGAGMVIGHEITHGFDDEGSQYDAEGNLKNWWTEKSKAEYDKRTACVVSQYDNYVAVEDEQGKAMLNGKLTLGENIADIGGLKLAFKAYKNIRPGKTPHTVTGGFTDEQAFFIAFAQTWCTNYRPQAARSQAKTNEHSLARWRVNGPAQDNKDFREVFGCAEGTPMAPKNSCEVW